MQLAAEKEGRIMALMEKDRSAVHSAGSERSSQAHSEATAASADAEGQNEQLWDAAITSSIDVIREMADKARAERQTGRTKKITL